MRAFWSSTAAAAAATLALALFSAPVRADTCSDVEALSNVQVSRRLSLAYTSEQKEYWSTSCSALKPSCILFPTSASEVAAIVKILADNDEQFAVKSGGHSPNNYFASVEGGPLISTAKLDEVTLDASTGIVRVGPGQRLDSVAAALDGTGWTFVGGRIGNTGVGGLMLGGGLSYMSAQYGWAASSVIEYEVVLADGTVASVTADNEHADLFVALRGGGNAFCIVTAYIAQAHRQGDIYGGNLVYVRTPATDRALLRAVRDFADHNTDDKAAVIVTAERAAVNLVDTWIIFLFYDGTDVPEGTFANFTGDAGGAKPTLNTLKVQSYASLIGGSNWVILPGVNVQGSTETLPVPSAEHGDEVMQGIHEHWRDVSKSRLAVAGYVASVAYMPLPRRIAQEAKKRNGGRDLIDLDDDVDRLLVEFNYMFLLPSDYGRMDETMQATYGGVRDRVLDWQADGTLADDVYLPLFKNYAFFRQDYFGRLKPESQALAQRVAEEYDPEGLFRDRTGGFKP